MDNQILKSVALKNTKKRQLILSILEQANQPLTAEEVFALASARTCMSFSTVYRCLGALAEKQVLLKQAREDKKTYYQFNTHEHKHLLVCKICGQTNMITGCPLHDLEERLSKETGYYITGHTLEFTGICPKCAMFK